MARDGSGTYTRVSNSFSSPIASTTIDPEDADAFFDDIETELTDSLSRTGKGGMSADLDMNNNDINEIKTAVFQGSTSGTTTVIATAIAGTTTLTLPAETGTLITTSTADVKGPSSSTDNAAARYDSTTGKLLQNSALIIADTTGTLSRSGNGGIAIQGTNTNDDAASGFVGEYAIASLAFASRTSLTTGTDKTVTSNTIPAGDFEVTLRIHYEPAATTSVTRFITSLSATNNLIDQSPDHALFNNMAANVPGNTVTQTLAHTRVSQAAPATWYAVVQATFTVSTMEVWGSIEYRRAR